MQVAAVVLSTVISLVAIAFVVRTAARMVGVVRLGQPAVGRTDHPGHRWETMLRETLGHTRLLKWSLVGAAHWFVFVGFGFLVLHAGHRVRTDLRRCRLGVAGDRTLVAVRAGGRSSLPC